MTLRFLTSFGMTESYVIREGWAAASPPPTPPTHLPLESPVIPNEVRNLLQVYRTLLDLNCFSNACLFPFPTCEQPKREQAH